MADDTIVSTNSTLFCHLADLGLAIDGSAFYPSIEPFYDTGDLPFIRVADVDAFVDFNKCVRIPRKLCSEFPTLKRVQVGDIVITKGGSVARIGMVTQPAAACRDLIFLNSSMLKQADRDFLAVYFQTSYFNRMLLRSSSQTAQPHLTLTLVRDLPVFQPSSPFRIRIATLLKGMHAQNEKARAIYTQAEALLLEELGLKDWRPDEPLSYIAKSSEAFEADRLDAERFRPKYRDARNALLRAGALRFRPLESLLNSITNGHTPNRHDLTVGDVPFLCSEHIHDFEISYSSEKRILSTHHEEELARTQLRNGDVLLTIKGRVGNAAIVENLERPANINQDVALLRFNNDIPLWYAVAYLNSAFGKLATEEIQTGQINPFLGLGGVRKLPIPVFNEDSMSNIAKRTEDAVHSARKAASESKLLIEKAKRAVEIAIERGEAAAIELLDGKAYVEAQALPAMTEQHKYFGLDALKQYLAKQKLTYAPETVNAYVSRMKREGKIFSAGRGWYSSIADSFETDPEPVAALVADLGKRFPLLEFACWSTGQLNPYLHHTLGKPVPFLYVDRDAMPSVFDGLEEMGYRAYLNPTRREASKSFVVTDKTVVVRPAVTKAPVDGHYARIEKLLVDLHVELETFLLLEPGEFREAAQSLISQRRIDLGKLLMYAAQRKVNWRAIFLAPDAVIAWDSAK